MLNEKIATAQALFRGHRCTEAKLHIYLLHLNWKCAITGDVVWDECRYRDFSTFVEGVRRFTAFWCATYFLASFVKISTEKVLNYRDWN